MVAKKPRFRKLAVQAAHAADEKQGENIVILDIRKITAIADYMMFITVNSSPHLRAVVQEIEELFFPSSVKLLHQDGGRNSSWVVLDYGGIVIHIMHYEARTFYAIEKLWRDARKVRWLKNSLEKK